MLRSGEESMDPKEQRRERAKKYSRRVEISRKVKQRRRKNVERGEK
jgi:hypothetical protein